MFYRWRQHLSDPLPINYPQNSVSTHTPASWAVCYRDHSCVCVYVCVCYMLWCWGVEGLSGKLQSYFRGPLGLFTTDPSVTDNHLPTMSIAHECLRSPSLCLHQSSSALRMCSVWGLPLLLHNKKNTTPTQRTSHVSFIAARMQAKENRSGFHQSRWNFMWHSHYSKESQRSSVWPNNSRWFSVWQSCLSEDPRSFIALGNHGAGARDRGLAGLLCTGQEQLQPAEPSSWVMKGGQWERCKNSQVWSSPDLLCAL